jgi:poly(A) polymerase
MTFDARRAYATEIVARLRSEGFEAYWAGGCVRDFLLGIGPSDYDVATDARPEQVMTMFRRTCAVGASFGVVRVLGNAASGDVEVATFRSDGVYLDGRRPESVTYSTAEFDASRRDFTINGMFYDPVDARVIDFVGGRADLDAGILRAIGDPSARFTEDRLRLLRAVRFAARFKLAIETETRRAIDAMAGEVTGVSAERIAQELRRMIVDPSRVMAMNLAYETGLVAAILPQLMPLKHWRVRDPVFPDGDLWDRTMRTLAELRASPSFPLAFAALVRDTALPESATDHERRGSEIARSLAGSLKLANAERDAVVWLIESHHALDDPSQLAQSRLKRILASRGVHDLLELVRAEAMATTGETSHVDFCEAYLRDEPAGPINPPPLLTGHDLVKHGLAPGPRFAILLDQVRDAQLDRIILTRDEALAFVDRINRTGLEVESPLARRDDLGDTGRLSEPQP